MSIVAGNIRCIVTCHALILDDKVLEYLIEGGAEVNLSVCIGRAIVKNVARVSLVLFEHFFVKFHIVPLSECLGLSLGESCAHRKFR